AKADVPTLRQPRSPHEPPTRENDAMTSRSWVQALFNRRKMSLKPASRPRQTRRLGVEQLEVRAVPATITPDGSGGRLFTAVAGVNNALSVTISGSNFVFNDTAEAIAATAGVGRPG